MFFMVSPVEFYAELHAKHIVFSADRTKRKTYGYRYTPWPYGVIPYVISNVFCKLISFTVTLLDEKIGSKRPKEAA